MQQAAPLIDPFARPITYLRVSVTDRCDFRCVYCMAEDMTFLPRQQVLGLEELERIALEDDYFIEKKLYPNVDFYSGIILKAIGIPTSMFTVIFALARTVGWISHWKEMLSSPYKIGRPRQLYVGAQRRDYVDVKAR
mgnify:CR=1 FL=1